MVDPNRKINLSVNDSSDEDLNAEQTQLVKEFEAEFCNKYTAEDPSYAEFCALPKRQIPIVDKWQFNNWRGRHNNNYQHRNDRKDRHYNHYRK